MRHSIEKHLANRHLENPTFERDSYDRARQIISQQVSLIRTCRSSAFRQNAFCPKDAKPWREYKEGVEVERIR